MRATRMKLRWTKKLKMIMYIKFSKVIYEKEIETKA